MYTIIREDGPEGRAGMEHNRRISYNTGTRPPVCECVCMYVCVCVEAGVCGCVCVWRAVGHMGQGQIGAMGAEGAWRRSTVVLG